MRRQICLLIAIGTLAFVGCSNRVTTEQLVGDMSSHEELDRVKAVRLLGHRRQDPDDVVPVLIDSLKDTSPDIRWSAAIALGYFGADAESAISALELAKRDRDARVREAARVAITRIKG